MFETLFERLFKYRAALFGEGDLGFAASPLLLAVVLAGALLAVPVALRYRKVRGTGLDRILLIAFRLGALGVVVFCLLQPVLVLTSVVPQESVVGLIVDDSLSMQVPDMDGRTRAEHVAGLLADVEGGGFMDALGERFKVRLFGFSRDARRVSSVQELSFRGSQSRIGRALSQVAEELAGVPISGLVVLTDGAQSADDSLSDVLLELRADEIGVFPVAIGKERLARDVEVSRVEVPRTVLKGSTLQVDVTLSQSGYGGEDVELQVIDEGRIVSSHAVSFPTNGEAVIVPTTFVAAEEGSRRFGFRVGPILGEELTANNQRQVLINVVDRQEKVLYFEGEPRYEVGFMKRAVQDDEGLQLVGLIRLAENHTFRFQIDDAAELADGFPKTREELFKYRGLILGSVEASYFTYDQMRMIVDFVSQRGGGLLLLGGRNAFAEGGYRDTPLAEVMPVVLGPARGGEGAPFFTKVKVRPTQYGRNHPAVQLASTPEASAALWDELPVLSTFNPLTRLKPGAASLLRGRSEQVEGELIVLAHQRYGRGRSLALTVHDTWHWQMSMPLEDLSHETLWRQLLRWLVSYVPDPVRLAADRDRVQVGEPVTLTANVRDDTYLAVNSARVDATVRAPSGAAEELRLEWLVEEDGVFRATFVPSEEGLYEVDVASRTPGEELGGATIRIESTELQEELFGAGLRSGVLNRIAAETNGRVYRPDQLDNLVEDLSYSRDGATVREYKELWDMPALFLVLLGLLAGEWGLRRARGLA